MDLWFPFFVDLLSTVYHSYLRSLMESFFCFAEPVDRVFPTLFHWMDSLPRVQISWRELQSVPCHSPTYKSWKTYLYSWMGTKSADQPLKLNLNLGQFPLLTLVLSSSFLSSGDFPFFLLNLSFILLKISLWHFYAFQVRGDPFVISAYQILRYGRKTNSR